MAERELSVDAETFRAFSRAKRGVPFRRILAEAERVEAYREKIADKRTVFEFDPREFAYIRRTVGSQHFWAQTIGVAQKTISTWERGYASPDHFSMVRMRTALQEIMSCYSFFLAQIEGDRSFFVDPVETKQKLESSVLKAAITDFEYDEKRGKIVAVAFAEDASSLPSPEFEKDKSNLIDALDKQAEALLEDLSAGTNVPTDRLRKFIQRYHEELQGGEPNPRVLHRFGESIRRISLDSDFRSGLGSVEDIALDGFNSDHLELMRLYFRNALARAQEVQMASIDEAKEVPGSKQFFDIANEIDQFQFREGVDCIDKDVTTLLRDIGGEISDIEEAERFTLDPERSESLRRRRIEAVKNGAIYVGRFVFFTSFFIAVTPAMAGSAASTVAVVVTILEGLVPGSVRTMYDRLREFVPILPRLPVLPTRHSK